MKTTQKQASTRLFKKLSALRATLSNEEREILDSLIVVEEDPADKEVTAHKMNTKAFGKATGKTTSKANEVAAHKLNTKALGKATGKVNSKANEVIAHKLNTKALGKATGKVNSKADEVIAHKINTKAVGKATGKATNKSTFRITFDPTSEEYKIQE